VGRGGLRMSFSVSLLNAFIVLDAQPVLFLFNHRLLYLTSMFSGTTVAQEFTEDSSDCFQLILSPMGKSAFEQLLLVDLFFNILLPSLEHLRGLASIVSHEVISNLSVGLGSSFSIVLVESCFLL